MKSIWATHFTVVVVSFPVEIVRKKVLTSRVVCKGLFFIECYEKNCLFFSYKFEIQGILFKKQVTVIVVLKVVYC